MLTVPNRNSVMILYSDTINPIGHGVRIVLAEKDINVEIHYVDPADPPRELADLNPYNTSLTLVDRDLVIYDSQIIMEYIDERFPHPPLMPVDPAARANDRQLRYRILRDLYEPLEAIGGDNEIAAANARKSIRDHLTAIAPAFAQLPYFMSEDYALADCFLLPLLWRLESSGIALPSAAADLSNYAERMFARDRFRLSLSEDERELGGARLTPKRRRR